MKPEYDLSKMKSRSDTEKQSLKTVYYAAPAAIYCFL
jgi:hypothetical protein